MGFLRQKGLISGFLESKYFKNSQSPQQYEKHHTIHTINTVKYQTSTEKYGTGTVKYGTRNF